ncbi:MAG TPA: glycosyltransferase family A protein [Acidimicrobiales bacterium]|nr:glycosyltransferase family A protein [Acidimicrobiales bacterium]
MSEPAVLPTVSVVLATYDRCHLLAEHLPVLLADPAATEVIVVDDGSSDDTAALLASLATTHLNLVPVTIPNSGTDVARRTGVERANGEVVLLLDDDVRPSEGLVTGHATRHAAETGIVLVGYMPTELPARRAPGSFATELYAREYETVVSRYEHDPTTILRSLWNGNVSIRRGDYLRAHTGARWPHAGYHEDANLGIACERAGLVGRFDRTLLGAHRHRVSLGTFRRTGRRIGYGNRELHERHGDILGPYDPDHGLEGLGPALRRLVAAADRPARGRALAGALHAVTLGAGHLRWWWLERRAGQLLRRVEIRRGARRSATSVAPGDGRADPVGWPASQAS